MSRAILFPAIISLIVLYSLPGAAAGEEWEKLTARSFELYEAGRYDEAVRVSREALEAVRLAHGDGHPVTAKSMNNLGAMLSKHGDENEAERLLLDALDILEKTLGEGHPGTSSALNNLAELYSGQERYTEAGSLFERAISIREKQPGDGYADLITSIENLAAMRFGEGRYEDSLSLFERSLELKREHRGENGEGVASTLDNIVAVHVAMADMSGREGDFTGAATHYRIAYTTMAEDLETDPATIASVMENAATASVRAEDYESAILVYNDLVRFSGEMYGENSVEAAGATIDLARAHMRRKDHASAVPLYRSGIDILEGKLPADDPRLERALREQASALGALAMSALEAGRKEESARLMAEEIQVRRKTGKPEDPSQAVRMSNLAGILVEIERYEEAEKLFRDALEIIGRSGGGSSDETVILRNLSNLYLLMGEHEKSAAVDSLLSGR